MPVGQLIALGVGSPSDITILTLTGLEANPVGVPGAPATGSPMLGVSSLLTGNTVYALPGRDVTVSWDGSTIIEGSIDLVTWTAIVSNVKTESLWIRPQAQVTVVIKKRYKL